MYDFFPSNLLFDIWNRVSCEFATNLAIYIDITYVTNAIYTYILDTYTYIYIHGIDFFRHPKHF